jgi:hypothetical protein
MSLFANIARKPSSMLVEKEPASESVVINDFYANLLTQFYLNIL